MSLAELMAFHVAVQHARLGIDDVTLRDALVDAFVARSHAALADSRAVLERLARPLPPRRRLQLLRQRRPHPRRRRLRAAAHRDRRFQPRRRDEARPAHLRSRPRRPRHARRRRTLHVGDSYERDVRAAHALGLRTAWLVPADRATSPATRTPTSSSRRSNELEEISPQSAETRRPSGDDSASLRLCGEAMKAGLIAAGSGERLRAAGIDDAEAARARSPDKAADRPRARRGRRRRHRRGRLHLQRRAAGRRRRGALPRAATARRA